MQGLIRSASIGVLVTGAVLAGTVPAHLASTPDCVGSLGCPGPQPVYRPTAVEPRADGAGAEGGDRRVVIGRSGVGFASGQRVR